MGVMLFLVFQPSLRSDRSSALALATGGAAEAQRHGRQDVATPAYVIIHNERENRIKVEALPSEYQRVPRDATLEAARLVLTTPSSDLASLLRLKSDGSARPTDVRIWVAAGGRLHDTRVSCAADMELTIQLDRAEPISHSCGPPLRICSFDGTGLDSDEPNGFSQTVLTSDQLLLAVFAPKQEIHISSVSTGRFCEFEYDEEMFAFAVECGVSKDTVSMLVAGTTAECVRDKWVRSGRTAWNGQCYTSSQLPTLEYHHASFVGLRDDARPPTCLSLTSQVNRVP